MKKPRPRKCRNELCKKPFTPTVSTTQVTCLNWQCAVEYDKQKKAKKEKKLKTLEKRETKEKLKALMTRTQWFAKLQVLVNQYVLWRDTGKPCCTCGTTNPNIKYDAGHFHTRKARPDIRFEITQIHRQCSNFCNKFGSGKRLEYEKFLLEKYGPEHVEWLATVKPNLKEQFPHWQDIEQEIIDYRALLRGVGVKPHI